MKPHFFLPALAASLLASPAIAGTCAAGDQFNFLYGSQTAATLAYGTTYTYTATSTNGASRAFTVNTSQNGMSATTVNGAQMPAISTFISGPGTSANDLVVGGTFSARTADITSNTRVATVTITFTQPVRDFTITIHDIDFTANQYRDILQVTGVGNSVTYVPAMSSPAGNSNATNGTRTAATSSLSFGPVTTPVTITSAQAVGTGASVNNSDTGTINVSFPQPVTVITVKYGNAPLTTGELVTGQQAMGIAGYSFCPMPQIAVTKTSAPNSGTLGAYNLPGNDLTYTLTVRNTGASPVDASTISLTDVLPAGITFRNTVLDTPSGTPFSMAAGSSGVSLSSSSPSYSKDGGATWTYTPTSGYDANVKAVRITPTGTMAANSSFAISFVAKVN